MLHHEAKPVFIKTDRAYAPINNATHVHIMHKHKLYSTQLMNIRCIHAHNYAQKIKIDSATGMGRVT